MKLTDKLLSKIADTLLTRVVKEDYEICITIKAKKGDKNETSKSSKSWR